jgi:hypothetical protein
MTQKRRINVSQFYLDARQVSRNVFKGQYIAMSLYIFLFFFFNVAVVGSHNTIKGVC